MNPHLVFGLGGTGDGGGASIDLQHRNRLLLLGEAGNGKTVTCRRLLRWWQPKRCWVQPPSSDAFVMTSHRAQYEDLPHVTICDKPPAMPKGLVIADDAALDPSVVRAALDGGHGTVIVTGHQRNPDWPCRTADGIPVVAVQLFDDFLDVRLAFLEALADRELPEGVIAVKYRSPELADLLPGVGARA